MKGNFKLWQTAKRAVEWRFIMVWTCCEVVNEDLILVKTGDISRWPVWTRVVECSPVKVAMRWDPVCGV